MQRDILKLSLLWTLCRIIPPSLTGFVMKATSDYLCVSCSLFLPSLQKGFLHGLVP